MKIQIKYFDRHSICRSNTPTTAPIISTYKVGLQQEFNRVPSAIFNDPGLEL